MIVELANTNKRPRAIDISGAMHHGIAVSLLFICSHRQLAAQIDTVVIASRCLSVRKNKHEVHIAAAGLYAAQRLAAGHCGAGVQSPGQVLQLDDDCHPVARVQSLLQPRLWRVCPAQYLDE